MAHRHPWSRWRGWSEHVGNVARRVSSFPRISIVSNERQYLSTATRVGIAANTTPSSSNSIIVLIFIFQSSLQVGPPRGRGYPAGGLIHGPAVSPSSDRAISSALFFCSMLIFQALQPGPGPHRGPGPRGGRGGSVDARETGIDLPVRLPRSVDLAVQRQVVFCHHDGVRW